MQDRLETVIFSVRWLLLPLALGLTVGVLLVLYKFCEKALEILSDIFSEAEITDGHFLVDVISLIDFFLIAGLLTMVMISGYENFISRTTLRARTDSPHWIGRITHHDLKLNLALTVVTICLFQLLQVVLALMEPDVFAELQDKVDIYRMLPLLIAAQVTVTLTAVALAWINRSARRESNDDEEA